MPIEVVERRRVFCIKTMTLSAFKGSEHYEYTNRTHKYIRCSPYAFAFNSCLMAKTTNSSASSVTSSLFTILWGPSTRLNVSVVFAIRQLLKAKAYNVSNPTPIEVAERRNLLTKFRNAYSITRNKWWVSLSTLPSYAYGGCWKAESPDYGTPRLNGF